MACEGGRMELVKEILGLVWLYVVKNNTASVAGKGARDELLQKLQE